MKRDTKLSGVLHVLLHLAEAGHPVTSEVLAKAMRTNPAVIRKILGRLREQGYVSSEKGHGGGWRLSCDPARVSLHDIYVAVGTPAIFAMGNRTESPGCLVEDAVNKVLGGAFRNAAAILLERFREVTLAELWAEFHHGYADPGLCRPAGKAGAEISDVNVRRFDRKEKETCTT